MQDSFSRLITAFGETRLREHMDQRRVLRVTAPEPGFTALLRFDDLAAAFAQGLFAAKRLRVMAGRQRVDTARIGLVRDGRIVPAMLEQLARQGVTVVVNLIDHALPALWNLCREAEMLTGDRLSAEAFTSFGPESGLLPHRDPYDVIILQLAGSKRWHFHGEPANPGYPPQSSAAGEEPGPVTCTELLRTGDIMFVPAGLRHHCSAERGSMHVSLVWRRRHGAALAQRLFKLAVSDATLTTPIDLMPDEDMVALRLAESKARLIEWIAGFDALALLELPRGVETRPEVQPPGPDATGPRLAVQLGSEER